MPIALFLHLSAAVIWVGGMFFAYWCLRPAAASQLEPPARLKLWHATFARFFPWVWVSVLLLLLTGYWLLFAMGGFGAVGLYVHLMQGLGLIMMVVFLHLYFAPYRRFKQALAAEDFAAAAARLNQIRILVGTNLVLGLLIIAAVRLLRGGLA